MSTPIPGLNPHLSRSRAVLRMPPTSEAVTQARNAVRETVRAWDLSSCLQGAESIATELVANAVVHARTPLELRLDRSLWRLRIEVADCDPRPPQLHAPETDRFQYRGLVVVDAFADRWDTRPETDGKTVWAELDTDPILTKALD